MGCKVSKTLVLGAHQAKNSCQQAGSPESATLASLAPTTVPAVDSSCSTSRSSLTLDGPGLSTHSNIGILQNRTQGESTSGNEGSEISSEGRNGSSLAVLVSNGWPDNVEIPKAENGPSSGDDLVVVQTASRENEDRNGDRKSTPELSGESVPSSGNGDVQPCCAGRCCTGPANACSDTEDSTNLRQVNSNKCPTAPSSRQASCKRTPGPAGLHCPEGQPAMDAYVCLPASTPATTTPPAGRPPLMRSIGPPHAKAIKITSVTVLQQPDTFNSLHGATIVTNGVTMRTAEDSVSDINSMLKPNDPAHFTHFRNLHTNTLDQHHHPPSNCNGGHVKVTNSHTIDYVHNFLADHIIAAEGASKLSNGSPSTKRNDCPGMKSGASGPGKSSTSPRIVNVTNSATQYLTNDAGHKIGAVHLPVTSAPSTPEERTPLSTSPLRYGGLAGSVDPADCSTLPSLDSRRKLPPIQTSLSHASQLKLCKQTVDPFMKPSLVQQSASTPNRDKQVNTSASSLMFREVEMEDSPDSSPSSTSTRTDCRASVDSSSSSDCSSDTMIGSRFKETLEKADTNALGWTSIEDFLSLRKSPNISLLELEMTDNSGRPAGENVLNNSLEVQEDHALAFETSKIRYNNFNSAATGTTRSFLLQSED